MVDARRILLIDSYDSFTHNLAALCRQSFPDCSIHIIRNDDHTFDVLHPNLSHFFAVIVGPGPGSPDNSADVGVLRKIWSLPGASLLPIFGVCLGLQSLVLAHGGTLRRLKTVKHGQISSIYHRDYDLFQGVGVVRAVRYHSLHTELLPGGEIEELAFADDEDNGHVVMAVKHTTKPFWAVQYHPESVKTLGGGLEVLQNFFRIAETWSVERGRLIKPWSHKAQQLFGSSWPTLRVHTPPSSPRPLPPVTTRALDIPSPSVTHICELLGVNNESSPFVMLDSAAKPGRFTIIGSLTSTSTRIVHYVGDDFLSVGSANDWQRESLNGRDVWSWIASFMRSRKFAGGDPAIPFWGGLVGSMSYEIGIETLGVCHRVRERGKRRHPDVNLVFVERSVVIDMQNGRIHVQSLLAEDTWVDETVKVVAADVPRPVEHTPPSSLSARVTLPDMPLYKSRIKTCQNYLASGDSYELCLTARTYVEIPQRTTIEDGSTSWKLYKSSRKCNPAPHAAYFRLQPSTLISSSPERFLSFSRPPHTTCELRPIKGTLRKGLGITRAVAEDALAGSVKEVAENLMIVDLIRHDLHGVVGDDVHVDAFCAVEEYETVWQMVSVIRGRLAQGTHGPDLDSEGELGWEVLRRSLPPGSMTGAPKKRSVEILQTLEDDDRGLYSGVIGYWDVGGGGDWAVTIRSCFKLDGDESKDTELWRLGAGGAITALSDVDSEWDEMVLKLQGVLRSFGNIEVTGTQ